MAEGELLHPDGVDVNQGATIRKAGSSGSLVYMYKGEPGIYFDDRGIEIGEEKAEKAGFDVKRHRQDRIIKEKLIEAERQARRDVGLEPDETPEIPEQPLDESLITERDDKGDPRSTDTHKLSYRGGGRSGGKWDVVLVSDPDKKIKESLTKEDAIKVMMRETEAMLLASD